MSKSIEIVEVFREHLFSHPTIQFITTQIHAKNLFGHQLYGADLEDILNQGRINFVQFYVKRIKTPLELGGCSSYRYNVTIEYYLERILNEDTEVLVQDFFEVIDDLIESQLGGDWQDTVDGFQRSDQFPEIFQAGFINDRPVVGGRYTYIAEK